MAKSPSKSSNPPASQPAEQASEAVKSPGPAPAATPEKHSKTPPTVSNSKKETSTRSKKQSGTAVRNGSIIPSSEKLEQLKAAVTAAGGTENLLVILQHVEQAGGKAEVEESIEAFRLLKSALEDSPS